MTPWGETLTPATTWQEYPRPQLVRPDWMNLNGEWQYFRRTSSENVKCEVRDRNFSGTILVPFGVESALSGIMVSDYDTNSRSVQMYRRYFTLPESYHGKTVLLHFGAVDWSCVVYVNIPVVSIRSPLTSHPISMKKENRNCRLPFKTRGRAADSRWASRRTTLAVYGIHLSAVSGRRYGLSL